MRRETKINLALIGLFILIAAGLYVAVFKLGGVSISGPSASGPSGAKPIPGYRAPDFTIKTTDGRTFKLSEMRGKVVFLNFFATWCGPCLAEVPELDGLNQRFMSKDFVMLAVSSEDRLQGLLPRFKSAFKTPPLFAHDRTGSITATYRVTGFPETYVIDKDGNIAKRFIGPYEWTHPDFIAFIEKLVEG